MPLPIGNLHSLKAKIPVAKKEVFQTEDNLAQQYLDIAGVIFIVIDKHQHVTMINKKGCEILGYEENEVLGKNWFDHFLKKDDVKQIKKVFNQILSGSIEPVEFYESAIVRKDGRERWIRWHNSKIKNADGHIVGTLSSGEDITEIKEAERNLKESENNYRTIIENSSEGIALIQEGRIIYANTSLEKMTGYTLTEKLGSPITDFFCEDDIPVLFERYEKRMAGEDISLTHEFRLKRKDGSHLDVELSGTKVSYDNKDSNLVVIRDITERKRTQERIGLLAEIADSAPNSILVHNFFGHIFYANKRTFEMHGYTEDEFMAMNLSDIDTPESAKQINSRIKQIDAFGEVSFEVFHRRKDGSTFPLLVYVKKIDWAGKPAMLSISTDITKLKASEQAARENEEKLQSIFLAAPTGIGVVVDRVLKEANARVCEITGYSPEELIGQNARILYPDDDEYERVGQEIYEQIRIYGAGTVETIFQRKHGGIIDVLLSSTPIDLNDLSKGVTFTVLDITKRKQMERALKTERDKAKMYLDIAGVIFFAIDIDQKVTMINPRGCEILGYDAQEIIGKNWFDHFVKVKNIKKTKDTYKQVVAGTIQLDEYREQTVLRKDGTERIIKWHNSLIKDSRGNIIGTLCSGEDITEQKQAEEMLRTRTQLNETLLDALPCIAFLVKPNSRKIIAANKAAFKANAIIGKPCYESWRQRKSPCSWCLAPKSWKTQTPQHVEVDDQDIIWDIYWQPVTDDLVLHYAFDITEKRQLERRLQQSQKMDAVGTLAGGVAHDFNNLLTVVLNNLSFVMDDLDPSHPHYDQLDEIHKYIQSATGLTQQLLGFARRGKFEVKPVNINEIIKNHNKMFGRTKKEITIRGKYQESIWVAEVDQNQIKQVLMNIYINSWQAMPHGGELHVQTENVKLGKRTTNPFDVKPGKFIKISITDNGIGMDEATQQKVFDPFFTTKEKERGTGMGLSSAYGIVINHNGFITLNSKPGLGTTINIFLPASKKKLKKEKPSKESDVKGTGTVLIIDDEQMILNVVEQVLKRSGYNVLKAKGGKNGIDLYSNNKDKIDVVILDIIMPDMPGSLVYASLKEINPDVKVLISSGYSLDNRSMKMLKKGCQGFIQKPFNKKQLNQKIQEVLNKN